MNYILLDTCVLVNCTLVNATDADPELLTTIIDRIREQGETLLLPDVVRLEYSRKVPEELELIKQQTKKFRNSVNTSVLPGPDVSKVHSMLDQLDAERNAAAERAQQYFLQVASDISVTTPIALTGDILAEAVGYVLAGQKPSRSTERGFIDPDSLIVASVASFVRANDLNDADSLLICSDNHKDFAQWDATEDTHVLADSIAEVIPCKVRFYKNPRQLLENELRIVVEDDKPLSEALDNYDRMAHTMSSLSQLKNYMQHMRRTAATTAIDPAVLEAMRRATAIDPALLGAMRAIDHAILEAMRRATAIDPALLGAMRAIDPAVLEAMRRATAIRGHGEPLNDDESDGEYTDDEDSTA